MSRGLALVGIAAVVVGLGLALHGDRSGRGQVAIVLDTAKGLVPGQQVKIAGATVGTIDKVSLLPGPKARIVASVDREHLPLRRDASCSILPEGLIAENYLECRPGSDARELRAGSDGLPTIPVEQTQVPVSLQDVLDLFAAPTPTRVQLALAELGIATAARGDDINSALRRANPTLAQANQVLRVLKAQRQQIAHAVSDTDAVVAELARRDGQVHRFVDRAAAVADAGARQRRPLAQAIERLPSLLRAAEPGLRQVEQAAASAQPILAGLRGAAPALDRATAAIPAFSDRAGLAVDAVGKASERGTTAVRSSRRAVATLRHAATRLASPADALSRFLVSARDTGGLEGLLLVLYGFTSATSLYDDLSHILAVNVVPVAECIRAEVERTDPPQCSHKYSAAGNGAIPINDPSCGPILSAWGEVRCLQPRGAPPRPAPQRRSGDPAAARPVVVAPSPSGAEPDKQRPRLPSIQETVDGAGPTVKGLLGGDRGSDRATRLLDFLLGP